MLLRWLRTSFIFDIKMRNVDLFPLVFEAQTDDMLAQSIYYAIHIYLNQITTLRCFKTSINNAIKAQLKRNI